MKLLLLSIIPQLIPLAFLILVSITAPTLKNIYLAKSNDGTIFGIFGYCTSDSDSNLTCFPISLNNSISEYISSNILSSSKMDELSTYFIIAPISAGLTFFSIFLTSLIISINGKITSSTWFISLSILTTVLAFLTSAFVCIITFLIFYPNVNWLAWCLIPSAVINLAAIVFNALLFKLLPSPNEILSDDDNDDEIENKNNGEINYDTSATFDGNNNFEYRHNLSNINNIPGIEEKNHVLLNENSANSSFLDLEKEKNSSINVNQQENDIMKSSSSKLSLKVPSINDPYVNDADSMMDGGSFNDNRLNDVENMSFKSSSSNFTSISQRPINANYYAGASEKPRIPLGNNQFNNQFNNQYNNNNNNQGNPYQQGHQQRQLNNFQNQMSSMPNQNKSMYMKKPKPYMLMGRPNNMNMNMNSGMRNNPMNPYLPQQGYQQNMNNRPYPYQNNHYPNNQFQQPFNPNQRNQFNSSIPPNGPNYNQQQNNFVPMKYKGRTKMNFPPASAQNDGPYSGFI